MKNELPPLQKEIIKLLGEKGALTKHEVAKALKKSYKNVLYTFSRLQKKELIKCIGVKHYKNQDFKIYWLTLKGIIEAYNIGVPIEQLKSFMVKSVKEKEKIRDVELFFSILEVLGREDSLTLLDMFDMSNNTPKLKGIPLSLIEKTDKLLNVIAQHEPYASMIKKMLQEYLEKLT